MKSNRWLGAIWKTAFCVAAAVWSIIAAPTDADKLYSVRRAGDSSGLKKFLEHGISPDTTDSRQITPQMYAAEISSVEAMRILLDHSAEVNAQNAFGSTALMWSAADPRKAQLLPEHGAELNKVARSDRTALITPRRELR